MPPKPSPKTADTFQLGLPFVRHGAAHDLSYYIGICSVFATYHKRWPTRESTSEEFRAARVRGYDGRRLEREVRFPGPELEADPAYQALRDRCRNEGAGGNEDCVDLAMLDPRYRGALPDEAVAMLIDSTVLAADATPGDVRYATGIAAHAADEMTLHCGASIRARAVEAARCDPFNPQVLRLTASVRARADDELKQFIDRAGMTYRSTDGPMADHFRLEAGDDGRLHVRYQMLEGGRYAGRFDVERLVEKLAGLLAARPDLAEAADQHGEACEPEAGPPVATGDAAGDEELRRQLRMLAPDGRSLKLPIQTLSRLPDIRRAVEQVGGVFQPRKQQFDFDDDIAAADVLDELVARCGDQPQH